MTMPPDGGGAAGAAGRPAPMRHRLRFAKAENVLLAENKRHQFARYHAWSLYHHDAIYTFIPKNACTTLRFSVAVDNGFLDHGSDPAWLDHNNPTFSAAPGFLVTARYSFVVLRCPFQRLAVAFLDKMLAPNPTARRFLAVADPTIKIAAEADRRLDQLTFADTVALMEESPADQLDHHFRPQVAFLVFEDYTRWFCLERFGAAIDTLADDLGFTVLDTRAETGRATSRLAAVTGAFAAAPAGQLAALKRGGQVPRPADLFTPALIDRVARFYADDIRLYKEKFGGEGLLFLV